MPEKNDARHLANRTLEQMRQQAVRVFESGLSRKQIAQWLGVHRNTVGRWLNAYARQGERSQGRLRRVPAARDSDALKGQVYSHMRMLQKRPRVQAYFRHPKIRYAA